MKRFLTYTIDHFTEANTQKREKIKDDEQEWYNYILRSRALKNGSKPLLLDLIPFTAHRSESDVPLVDVSRVASQWPQFTYTGSV